MSRQSHKAPKLPKELLDRVEGSGSALGRRGRGKKGPLPRKEQRKANRVQKKVQQQHLRRHGGRGYRLERDETSFDEDEPESDPEPVATVKAEKSAKTHRDTLKKASKGIIKNASKDINISEDSGEENAEDREPISRSTKMALAQDEEEIALLEKRLGLGGKKTTSKAFAEDGLDELLEGIDNIVGFNEGAKRRREDEEWLKNKRARAATTEKSDDESHADTGISSDEFGSEAGYSNSDIDGEQTDEMQEDEEMSDASFNDFGDDDAGFISEDSDTEELSKSPSKRVRENPYLPGIPTTTEPSTKYIPPSLRGPPKGDVEALSRLRRQIQGLFNRLSEANMMTILREIEGLFHSNPRQYVTSTLIDLIIGLICDRASLMDTFIILHAGFVSAVYKAIGTQFGAQLLERMVSEFDKFYGEEQRSGNGRKEASNLIALFAEMYTFQVISSTVLFDLIRLLLTELSELNTELLLKLIKSEDTSYCEVANNANVSQTVDLNCDRMTQVLSRTLCSCFRNLLPKKENPTSLFVRDL
jgi:nucleolar MIF4G domain-containing protein 1